MISRTPTTPSVRKFNPPSVTGRLAGRKGNTCALFMLDGGCGRMGDVVGCLLFTENWVAAMESRKSSISTPETPSLKFNGHPLWGFDYKPPHRRSFKDGV